MLESLELVDFKGFRHSKADLGQLSLIVGANGAGKSNLRDALRLLHGIGLGNALADILGDKYGQGGILQWRGVRGGAKEASFRGGGSFALTANLRVPAGARHHPGQPFTYHIEVDVSNLAAGPRVRNESLHGAAGCVFDSGPKGVELASARPLLSQLAERQREPAATKKACRAVLDVLGSMRFFEFDPGTLRLPSPPGRTVLGDHGENLSSVLASICADPGRRKTLLEWLRALTQLDAQDLAFRADFAGNLLVHLVEGSGFEMSALSVSDGTLRFLAMVAALLGKHAERLLFFETLDNGIHPSRLHLLLDLVRRSCPDGEIQLIGTTHNPALLAVLDPAARENALLVYRSENAEGSRMARLAALHDVHALGAPSSP